MIYLDTSVLLARLFAEDRFPPDRLWAQTLVASRLLQYEVFNRVHARGAAATHLKDARRLLDRVSWLEMTPQVLARALEPFAEPVRTLDSLHLSSMDFLRAHGQMVSLASYDRRLSQAALSMGFALETV